MQLSFTITPQLQMTLLLLAGGKSPSVPVAASCSAARHPAPTPPALDAQFPAEVLTPAGPASRLCGQHTA